MSSRITIFDHFCKPLKELDAGIAVTPRSWVKNGYGKAEINIGFDYTLPQSEQLCREEWFREGNLILIEHVPNKDENGTNKGKLIDWVGWILTPQVWNSGTLHIEAYSAESIFAFRSMPTVHVEGTPGEVFKRIVDLTNQAANNIRFQIGTIDDKSVHYSDELSINAYDHIRKMVGTMQMEWDVTGMVNDKGELELFANLYARRGMDTGFELNNSNTALNDPLLTVQGTIINHVFGYSDHRTSNERIKREGFNQASIDLHGEMQVSQTYTGMKNESSVQAAAQMFADLNGAPRKLFERTALDVADTFQWLDIGNTLNIHETRAGFNPNGGFGFDAQVKIISLNYNDLTEGKCRLNLEVIE